MLKHIAKIVTYTVWITGIIKIDKTYLKPPNNFRRTNLKDMLILKGHNYFSRPDDGTNKRAECTRHCVVCFKIQGETGLGQHP